MHLSWGIGRRLSNCSWYYGPEDSFQGFFPGSGCPEQRIEQDIKKGREVWHLLKVGNKCACKMRAGHWTSSQWPSGNDRGLSWISFFRLISDLGCPIKNLFDFMPEELKIVLSGWFQVGLGTCVVHLCSGAPWITSYALLLSRLATLHLLPRCEGLLTCMMGIGEKSRNSESLSRRSWFSESFILKYSTCHSAIFGNHYYLTWFI